MCNPGGKGCNWTLNRRFEDPAKELIRELVRLEGRVVLPPAEARIVGYWFLKTLLLWAHPKAYDSVFERRTEPLRATPRRPCIAG